MTAAALAFLGICALLAVAVLAFADSTQVQRRLTASTATTNSQAEAGASYLQADTSRPACSPTITTGCAPAPCTTGLTGTLTFTANSQTNTLQYNVTSCSNSPTTCVLCLNPGATVAQNTGFPVNLYGVDALNATHVWAAGDNCTVLFYDGASWTKDANVPAGCAANLKGVGIPDKDDAWAVGANGLVLECTANCDVATATWSALASGTLSTTAPAPSAGPTPPNFAAVWAADADHVYAAGTTAGGAGQIWSCVASGMESCTGSTVGSGNGQAPWTNITPTVPSVATTRLTGIAGSGANEVFVVGSGGTVLLCTGNACTATTWNSLTGSGIPPNTVNFAGAFAADANDVYAVGANGSGAGQIWACSAACNQAVAGTGKATWANVTPSGLGSTALFGVTGSSANTAWVVGAGGYAGYCAADCAAGTPAWTAQSTGTTQDLYAVTLLSKTSALAVGASGTFATFSTTPLATELTIQGGTVSVQGDIAVNGKIAMTSMGGSTPMLSAGGTGSQPNSTAGIYEVGTDNCTVSDCSPLPKAHQTTQPDPLAGKYPIATLTPSKGDYNTAGQFTTPLVSGQYHNIQPPPNTTVTLAGGNYVITGQLNISSGSQVVTTAPTTLYFACANYPAPCSSGGASATLTDQGSIAIQGPSGGAAIVFDQNNDSNIKIGGGQGGSLGTSGSIDAPSANLQVQDNATVSVLGLIVADSLTTTAKTQSVTVTTCYTYNAATTGTSSVSSGSGQAVVQPACTGAAGIVNFDFLP